MKKFLRMTLAVITGLVIFSAISFFIMMGLAGSMSMKSQSAQSIPSEAVLKIDMSEIAVVEQTVEINPLASLQTGGKEICTIGILDAAMAINKAVSDPSIKMIYLKVDGNMTGIAHLEELRSALKNFRKSGNKPIIAYTESSMTGGYYLASVADKVYMSSHLGASPMLNGISSQMTFVKDILDKLGVNVQLIRHGKYKSAGEMFIRNSPSEANMEQYRALIGSMWNSVAEEIAESREISVEALNGAIDGLRLNLPEDFLAEKLVDGLLTREELKGKIASLVVKEKFEDVKFVSFADYVNARKPQSLKIHKEIAVIYADGQIVDGSENKDVAGDRFASILSKVRADSTVKAVVLRVNSPGGSVLASEKIKAELDLIKGVKPLVASYGEYAASGGYWISNNCDKIYSDATTLTGSIGVFSMIPDFSKTLKDIVHVNIVSVSSNKHGDMYSLMRPLDTEEQAFMQRSVEVIYDKFTGIVAEGRGLEVDYVDGIAQGRVWTGADGLSIKLVDEIGTLEDAIKYAAMCSGDPELANWRISAYPRPLTTLEEIWVLLGEKQDSYDNIFAGTYLENTAKTLKLWSDNAAKGKGDVMFARLPFDIEVR